LTGIEPTADILLRDQIGLCVAAAILAFLPCSMAGPSGLSPEAVARVYGYPAQVRRYPVDSLQVLKISYPRAVPQGGALERDMHGGQQYVRLLDVELGAGG
jgi:hypothetical protein